MNHFKSYLVTVFIVILIGCGVETDRVEEVRTLRTRMPHEPLTVSLCHLGRMMHFIGGRTKFVEDNLEIRQYRNEDDRHYFAIKRSTQTLSEVSFWDFDVESFLYFFDTKIRLNLRNSIAPEILNTIIITFSEEPCAQYFYQLAATNHAKGEELEYGATKLETYQRYSNVLIRSTADFATRVLIFRKDTTGDKTMGTDDQPLVSYTASVKSYSLLTPADQGENPKPQIIFSTEKFSICSSVKDGNKILITLENVPNYIFVLHFDAVNGRPQAFFDELFEDWDYVTPMISDNEADAVLAGTPFRNFM